MLTLEYLSSTELEQLSSQQRVDKLLALVKQNKIVLLEGVLTKNEATVLIKTTMESINQQFRGIEFAVLFPEQKEDQLMRKLKLQLINLLLGQRRGVTIIGPASIVKQIKQDPHKISLYTKLSPKNSSKGGKLLKQSGTSRRKT